ncbi:unnamed protein product [Meloidogyne enterolobii]|uniref:Uncharacterized protein n=1 Tax=Meloidogyne enterolobii TaxID=390850 RepID=A0ACB1B3F9_MELEN
MFFKCLLIGFIYLNVSCEVNTSKVKKEGGKGTEPVYPKIVHIEGSSNFDETLKLFNNKGKQPEIEEKANSSSKPRYFGSTANKEGGMGAEPGYPRIVKIEGSSNFEESLKLLNGKGKEPAKNEKANSSSKSRIFEKIKSGSKGKSNQNLEMREPEQAEPRIFDLKSLGNPYGYEIGSMWKGKQDLEMKTPEQGKTRSFDLKANGINPLIYSEQTLNSPIVWNKNKGPTKVEGEELYKAKNSPKTPRLTLRRVLSLKSSVSEEDFDETPASPGKKQSGLTNTFKRIGSLSKRNNKGVPVGSANRGFLKRFFTINKGKKNHMDNEMEKAKNSEEDKIAELINMLTFKDDSSEGSPVRFSDTTLKKGDGSSFSSSNPSNPLSLRSSLDKSFTNNYRVSDVAKEIENYDNEDSAYKQRLSDVAKGTVHFEDEDSTDKQRLSDVAKETENSEDYDSEDIFELNHIKGNGIENDANGTKGKELNPIDKPNDKKTLKRKHEADEEEDDGFEEYEINSDQEIKLIEQKKMSKIQKIGK